LRVPASGEEVIRRLTDLAEWMGVTVVLGVAPDSLARGRFDLETKRIVVYGGYSAESQAVELAHQLTHCMTPAVLRWGIDCEQSRCQDVEQLARSVALLLAQRLGWDADTEDTIWDASVTEQRQQQLLPYVEYAYSELAHAIGL
jgi:hypothetical protein